VIESPHETEARYATKRGQGWIGYKIQVTESCDDDRPHLVVDLEPTAALDNDSPELAHIQARLQKQGTTPSEQYVDQGYMSGKNLVNSAELGICLMGIPLSDTRRPEGFRQADFCIDEEKQQAICPAGQTSSVWSQRPARHGGDPPAIQVRFDAQTCQQCRFFGQCTASAQGRSLGLHPYRAALYKRRAEAQKQSFQQQLHLRAGIEATISELVRGHQFRRARYRGQAKLRLQAYFTAIAVNLKRTVSWLNQPDQAAKLSLFCC